MPLISMARRVAFEVLLRVETESAYASDLLHTKLKAKQGSAGLSSADAGLATELTFGVLRWQRRLDHFLHSYTRGRKLDAPVRIALRLGAYQLLFLDRVPPHAAVNESVELVKKAGVRSAAGLVNAVLRKLAQGGARKDVLPPLPRKASLAEQMGILASHPTWIVERWMARFGEENTSALLAANNAPAPVALARYGDEVSWPAEWPAAMRLEPGMWLQDARRISSASTFLTERESLPAPVHFQDEASQMVAHLVGVHPGQRVLDLCAAPGGKTLALACRAGAQGRVFAADLHLHRLRAMRARFGDDKENHSGEAHLNLHRASIHLVAVDATQPLPFAENFDRILVDAPCSGTGTLARNPEIRWRITPQDLTDLAERQGKILAHALDALAPGGRLVYSTCSLEKEENDDVVERMLAERPECRLADGRALLQPHVAPGVDVDRLFDLPQDASGRAGYFRTFPPAHHTDGFFAAIIEKQT